MILWADGFDHYGTGSGALVFMLRGAWAAFQGTVTVSNAQARTGARSLQMGVDAAIGSLNARRVIGVAKTVVGCGFGFYMQSLPGSNGAVGQDYRTAANTAIVSLRVNADGSIAIHDSAGTLLQSSDPVLTASAWHHIESKIVVDDVVGDVEIRVNGRTVMHATNLNLGTSPCGQVRFGAFSTTPGFPAASSIYYDDIVVWDDTGDVNNDFLGVQRVLTTFPAGDEATQDWTINGAATGHEAIDDTTPNDSTDYISSADVGDISEFSLPALPPETANIVGIYIPAHARLSDAGTGGLQVSMLSGGDVSLGPDDVLTAAYTYWPSLHEKDPDTDDLWTKAAVEAAIVRVEKTS